MFSDLDRIAELIERHSFRYSNEDQLQAAIHGMLREHGFHTRREMLLSARDRIDLGVGEDDLIAIEVKVAGSPLDAMRQLKRYAEHDRVKGLVLVTNRARGGSGKTELNGKPVKVVSIAHQGL